MAPSTPPDVGPDPSRTGQVVAAWRAGFPRPCSPDGDPDAQAALCAGMVVPRALPLRAHLEARTRFFDDQVVAAIGRGTGQVVVLGAGYDDRALRFRTPGVRFFEADHPGTQSDKSRRLEHMGSDNSGPTLVPADFRVDDVGAALARVGHRGDHPTLVLAEGLLVYLDGAAVVGLLYGVHARAAAGSTLVASLAVHPEGIDSAQVLERANAARPGAAHEPWRTILSAPAHLELVSRSGWTVVESVDDAALGTGAVPGRSLLVVARP
jgi:methyltransferase (TIGR00027 family)